MLRLFTGFKTRQAPASKIPTSSLFMMSFAFSVFITILLLTAGKSTSEVESYDTDPKREAKVDMDKVKRSVVEKQARAHVVHGRESVEVRYIRRINDLIHEFKQQEGIHNMSHVSLDDRNVLNKVLLLNESIATLFIEEVLPKLNRPAHVVEFLSPNKIETALMEQMRFGIPASIILAQACDESAYGRSRLAIEANNFFGIKAAPETPDENRYLIFTDEEYTKKQFRWAKKKYPAIVHKGSYWKNGKRVYKASIPAYFRKYSNFWYSFRDHSMFLVNRKGYQKLFANNGNWKQWVEMFKPKREGGVPYATSGSKSKRLGGIITKNKLFLLDI